MNVIRNSDMESKDWFNYSKKFDIDAFIYSCPFIDNTVRTEALQFFKTDYDFGPI
jgi:hypothetical protein